MSRRIMRLLPLAAASIVAICQSISLYAADAKEGPTATAVINADIEEVLVQAHPLSAEGLAGAYSILDGEELDRQRAASIGETLATLPGIHSASFGPAVGRPVIHGLDGPRVRVMEDRIDSMDVSVTSGDHAVTIDPFVAERVEILKGPATLLYGSGAIGGAVDVHTGRIPHEIPDSAIGGRAELRGADNGDSTNGALRLDGAFANIAWHVDGFMRDADEYDIPGFAESGRLRSAEAEEGGEGEAGEEEEEVRGRLPGSQYETKGGAVGASWIGEWGFAGLSVSRLDSDYGLPGGHEHEHEEGEEEAEEEEEEGQPLLTLEQTRIDLEIGVIDPLPGFESLNIRLGNNDYEHQEIEPNGEIATTFENKASELRLELVHEPVLAFSGALGIQAQVREFSAVGEEAFIAPVDSDSVALFWLGERELGEGDLEIGGRIERVSFDPSDGESRRFTAGALAIGYVLPLQDYQLGLNLDIAQRAPVGEELYSNGPHLATSSFELGDDDLDTERSRRLSATLRRNAGPLRFEVTGYVTSFDNYIFARARGDELDDLPVFQFEQSDADYYGVDIDATAILHEGNSSQVALRFMADAVEGSLDGSGDDDIARLPPSRFGFGLDANWRNLDVSVDWLRVSAQNDVTEFELATDSYDDLSLFVGYRIAVDGAQIQAFLEASNLTDEEQRNHSSFIKDFAPNPGRTISAGLRVAF
ncbi:MAG: TonB-dependent receptor [Pseudomonadaceae bacterium]|nr:TonB-dependent receptor [Pseudomonadaceae bacterium]